MIAPVTFDVVPTKSPAVARAKKLSVPLSSAASGTGRCADMARGIAAVGAHASR
jgi:hypothetical protein